MNKHKSGLFWPSMTFKVLYFFSINFCLDIVLKLQCVFFYADQSICSFDPLKIVSGQSNISQNLRIPRTFDKNTPTIFKNIFLRYFSLFSQKRYISLFQSKCAKQKMTSTHGLYTIVCHSSLNNNTKMINILLECLKKKQLKKIKNCQCCTL